MSGSQSALFGGGSRWITNPKHLSFIAALYGNISVKTASTTIAASNTVGFFTAAALRGAQTSITVADTYVTVASVSGAGFLVNCVSPTHSSAHIPTIRITVDGVAYTIAPSANHTALWRTVLGSVTTSAAITARASASIAGDLAFPNSPDDAGFANAPVGGVVVSSSVISLPSPETALAYGLPVLRFESSLLVEMKCSGLSATAVDKQCAATYRLDL